ncbi:uncharacterized protein B0H18DRAFT_1122876 [Fomitopsis serialis]|uniref:uncharacterized protein n=1 Tax=Fomitopsis serialis TaxID=139415 RepID=UPI0020077F60|nr:uncharacterized protein B0H18DRAFT_1122876 [Neoantrodia serialis]KAH9918800.1 hypothetical protein B0H18DRAFT_1122876 [Neoantrodia serialis]
MDMLYFIIDCHKDGKHVPPHGEFHKLFFTAREHNTSDSEGYVEKMAFRIMFEEIVYDVLTAWDRFTGGATVMMHVNANVPPNTVLHVQNVKIHAYIPPPLVIEDRQARYSIARMAQEFAKEIGIPAIRQFHSAYNTSIKSYALIEHPEGPFASTPHHGVRSASRTPLIPPPLHKMTQYMFYGCPDGEVEDMITAEEEKHQPCTTNLLPLYESDHTSSEGPGSVPEGDAPPSEGSVASDSDDTLDESDELRTREQEHLLEIRLLKEKLEKLERRSSIQFVELSCRSEELEILKLQLALARNPTPVPVALADSETSGARAQTVISDTMPSVSSISSISSPAACAPQTYGDNVPPSQRVPLFRQPASPCHPVHALLVPFGEHSKKALAEFGLPDNWYETFWKLERNSLPENYVHEINLHGLHMEVARELAAVMKKDQGL